MSIYNIYIEGQQAEEYLKRKQEAKKKQADEEKAKYGENYEKYDYYGEKNYRPGTRSQDTKIDYNGNKKDYSEDSGYRRKSDNNPSYNNPRFNAARDMEEHRKKYSDVMPSKKTKTEIEYDKAKAKDVAAKEYADRVAHKYLTREKKAVGGGYYDLENPEYAAAADAARKHYRKTHKLESGIFAECVLI